jgi:hypothetical protein
MFTDNKKVFVKVRNVNSSYGYANKNRLVELQINRTIGTSVTSVNKMMANAEEQKVLMPDIIAISSNSADWNKQLKDYWNSFSIDIAENGKELEIGFVYDINGLDKKDYITQINKGIDKEKDKLTKDEDLKRYIDKRIEAVIHGFNINIKNAQQIKNSLSRQKTIDNAYRIKYDNIVKLESERYKVGTPINAFEYMLYRYCLVYGDVANDFSLVSKSPKIRFYLHSEEDIKKMKKAKQESDRSRTRLLLEVTDSVESMEDLLYAMGEGDNIPTDDVDLYEKIEKLSLSRASDFMRFANNKDLPILGKIEKYIASGIFTRHIGSSAVFLSTDMEKPIGNNIDEVLAYFKNAANKAVVKELETKYKNLVN